MIYVYEILLEVVSTMMATAAEIVGGVLNMFGGKDEPPQDLK